MVLQETLAVPRDPQCCRGMHLLLQPETSSGPGWEGEPVAGPKGSGVSFISGGRVRRWRGCSASSLT